MIAALHSLIAPFAAAAAPARGAPTSDLIPATLVGFARDGGHCSRSPPPTAPGAPRSSTALAAVATRVDRPARLVGAADPRLQRGARSPPPSASTGTSAIHIDDGRDPGPFANDSHFLILAGLAGITLAGFLSVILGTDRKVPSSLRLAGVERPARRRRDAALRLRSR